MESASSPKKDPPPLIYLVDFSCHEMPFTPEVNFVEYRSRIS